MNCPIDVRRAVRLLTLFGIVSAPLSALGQSAPLSRAVVPLDEAPESIAAAVDDLSDGSSTIAIEGAAWLQLRISDFDLGIEGTLTIESESGETQTFTQAQLEGSQGLTGMFSGSTLTVIVEGAEIVPGTVSEATARIAEVIIGLPAASGDEESLEAAPSALRRLMPDLERFIPDDVTNPPGPLEDDEAVDELENRDNGEVESICGSTDNRTTSNHPIVGRISPIGCTGWVIKGGSILTAGHCISSATQTLELNVPSSLANGTTVPSAIVDQYAIVSASIVTENTGVGNDWAVFDVLPNTQTGLTPIAAQGGGFSLSNTQDPQTLRITGYGVDGPPPQFGTGPRNVDNQTQQTHTGFRIAHSAQASNRATLRYRVDTQGANSGGPVLNNGSTIAVGIHTNGGCNATGGANAATSFRNMALWRAVLESDLDQIDAALLHPNGRAYFFRGGRYQRFNFSTDKVDKTGRIHVDGWRGLWTTGFDAAVMHPNGRAYFFRGNQYQRFNFGTDKVDKTGRIDVNGWKGLWTTGIDAAVMHPNSRAYFFTDQLYQRFNFSKDRVDRTARTGVDGWLKLVPAIR